MRSLEATVGRRFIDMRSVNAKLDARDRRFQRDAELRRTMHAERVPVCPMCADVEHRTADARSRGRDVQHVPCEAHR